jgi:hypothetical protein
MASFQAKPPSVERRKASRMRRTKLSLPMTTQAGPLTTATRRGGTPSSTAMHRRASAGGSALIPQRDLPPVKWPVSERGRWLPALAMALGIIYGDESGSRPSPVRKRGSPD